VEIEHNEESSYYTINGVSTILEKSEDDKHENNFDDSITTVGSFGASNSAINCGGAFNNSTNKNCWESNTVTSMSSSNNSMADLQQGGGWSW
jgi:hypothetical protein